MDKCSVKGWLYLLPAIAFLGVFMVYPLVDVFVYSFEEVQFRVPDIFRCGPVQLPLRAAGPYFCRH